MQVVDCNNQVWQLNESQGDVQLSIKIDGVGFESVADFDDYEQALTYIEETSGGEVLV